MRKIKEDFLKVGNPPTDVNSLESIEVQKHVVEAFVVF